MSGVKLDANRILVPVNGDQASEHVFRWACQLARQSKAHLHAVYVIEVPLEMPVESEIGETTDRGEEILPRIEVIDSKAKFKDIHTNFLRARQAVPDLIMRARDTHHAAHILGIPYPRRF